MHELREYERMQLNIQVVIPQACHSDRARTLRDRGIWVFRSCGRAGWFREGHGFSRAVTRTILAGFSR